MISMLIAVVLRSVVDGLRRLALRLGDRRGGPVNWEAVEEQESDLRPASPARSALGASLGWASNAAGAARRAQRRRASPPPEVDRVGVLVGHATVLFGAGVLAVTRRCLAHIDDLEDQLAELTDEATALTLSNDS
jgi:hypothetical protein